MTSERETSATSFVITRVVIGTATLRSEALRWVWLTLAVLAIVFKILVPPGFMAAGPLQGGLPLGLVICTGSGPLAVGSQAGDSQADVPHDAPAGKSSHDMPCGFAANGMATPAPNLLDVAIVEFVAHPHAPVRTLADLAPGRGLAAPPLPARGPPNLLT